MLDKHVKVNIIYSVVNNDEEMRKVTQEVKEKCLEKIFSVLKRKGEFVCPKEKTFFTKTELQLIGELVLAKRQNRRLFSSQLAKLLGITRSAVSHIVNRLEKQGVLVRTVSSEDKKVEYVDVSDSFLEEYRQDYQAYLDFTGEVVESFGQKEFFTMCELFERFAELVKDKISCNKKV